MTAIDRTAYPRPGARLTRAELTARYDLADADLAFIRANARGDEGRLTLATLLKTRQYLGRFVTPNEAHPDTVGHLATQLGLATPPAWPDDAGRTKSLYRYQAAVRAHLSVRSYDETAERLVADTTQKAAETMSDPADLINRAVETLQAAAIDRAREPVNGNVVLALLDRSVHREALSDQGRRGVAAGRKCGFP